MTLLYFLTLFPLVPALGMLLARGDRARDAVGLIGSGIIMAVTVVVAVMFFGTGPQSFEVAPGTSHVLSIISSAIDVILCAVILYNAFKYGNALTTVLGIVQLVGSLAFAAMTLPAAEAVTATPLYLDYMSVIMVLAVGIVGSLICVYALGYMKDFQAHDEHEAALRGQTAPDRRPQFLALMFLFLSAMFVIVTSDNLEWLFCGWEITTVCSFLMIGYTRTPEAIKNAFIQIILIVMAGHYIWLAVLYLLAGAYSGKNPWEVLRHYGPAYLTAVGTMSSAATLAVALDCARKSKVLRKDMVSFGIPLFANIHLCGSVLTEVFFCMTISKILYGHLPSIGTMLLFCALLGIFAIGAPGVPGGTVMASLGLITGVLMFDDAGTALMLAIFALQDSFGTACNVTGDGALTLMLTGYAEKHGIKNNDNIQSPVL